MRVKQAVEEYGYAVLTLSPHTQRWYQEKLEVFSDWCQSIPLEELRAIHIRKFIANVSERTNPHTKKPLTTHTVRGYTQVVKGFINWCSEEYGDQVVSHNVTRHIALPKVDQEVIEIFTNDHIRAMFKACEQEYNDELVHRDKAILCTLR